VHYMSVVLCSPEGSLGRMEKKKKPKAISSHFPPPSA
jgi:hypothetical protein